MIRLTTVGFGLGIAVSAAIVSRPRSPLAGAVPSIQRVGELAVARAAATASAIRNDRVLVAGGMTEGGAALRSFEILAVTTGRIVAKGEMADSRVGHTATSLPDGRVLVIGGYNGAYLKTAEIFDPATGRLTPTGTMPEGRSGHTATLLRDGTVLVTGGVGDGWSFLATALRYDVETGTFAAVGPMSTQRESHTATLLPNGRVLIAGGHRGRRERIEIFATTEIYDPTTRAFQAGPTLLTARHKHEAVGLADGRVLILGGSDPRDRVRYNSIEVYDPRTNSITAGPSMRAGRYKFRDTSVRLADGRVLVAGSGRIAELFDPRSSRFEPVAGDFGQDYSFAAATPLADGGVLIVGGYDDAMRNTTGVWRFRPR